VDGPDGPEHRDEHGVRLDHAPGAALATVVLDRPEKRNAQTPAMWRRLAAIGVRLLADDGVRVVLLRAEGASFSAGLDRAMFTTGVDGEPGLLELAALDDAALDRTIDGFQQAFAWWRDDRIVSIAAVQGHAVGAGFQLALGCDLRVVADDVQLAMKETSLGLVPDLGGTRPLVDLVGYARALEICLTGRWVGADEAVASGLASVAVPAAELDGTARDLAAAVLAAPPGAVRATKALLRGARNRGYHDQRGAERAAQAARLRELAAALAPTAGETR
jgi:enoyl-CoA hydratase/carnithine racemase